MSMRKHKRQGSRVLHRSIAQARSRPTIELVSSLKSGLVSRSAILLPFSMQPVLAIK